MKLAAFLRQVRQRPLHGALLAAGLLVMAILLRMATPISLIFVTFYPAVLIATVAGGKWLGSIATLIATLVAVYLFLPPFYTFSLRTEDAWNVGAFLVVCALIVLTTDLLVNLITLEQGRTEKLAALNQRLVDSERRQQTLMRELSHRMKNQYAVILAMARGAEKSSSTVEEFQEAFAGRMLSMSRAHDLLTKTGWESVSLAELIDAELSPFATPGGFKYHGDDVRLKDHAVAYVGMALHELATNCVKHGAWQVGGEVSITWTTFDGGVKFSWQEHGGASSPNPTRRGFGLLMLDKIVPAALQGSSHVAFDPDGLSWTLTIPGDCIEMSSTKSLQP